MADRSGAPKPALTISAEFQEYIQKANLDRRRGKTFWSELPKSTKEFENKCRLIVRALRNKKSASSSMQKDKEQRLKDKTAISRLTATLAEAKETVKNLELICQVHSVAAESARPVRTTSITGEEAVELLRMHQPSQHPVRPMANTLYECGGNIIKELGSLTDAATISSSIVSDGRTGVVFIGPDHKTKELANELGASKLGL
ncbi:MAG: hypothetical protein CL678_01170 [Bdellovibrionaceae bacterium]|nr:hypothetical protein [Pseudobdellovibrionaceae bacterium]